MKKRIKKVRQFERAPVKRSWKYMREPMAVLLYVVIALVIITIINLEFRLDLGNQASAGNQPVVSSRHIGNLWAIDAHNRLYSDRPEMMVRILSDKNLKKIMNDGENDLKDDPNYSLIWEGGIGESEEFLRDVTGDTLVHGMKVSVHDPGDRPNSVVPQKSVHIGPER
ncbi:MAG TPA: hypothetical protein PKA60_01805 [Candidatus Paceibacterota bacterium]|nr:hypothetical protein [Candidatus Paceibacterota bacterium]